MTTPRSVFEIDENGVQSLVEDVQYLWCRLPSRNDAVTVLGEPPSVLEFLRDYVAVSRPCIIRNAASFRCTVQDLVERCPQMELVVDVSPDGHADVLRSVQVLHKDSSEDDCIRTVFVQPEQRNVTVEAFHERLSHSSQPNITDASSCQEPLSRVFATAPKRPTHANDATFLQQLPRKDDSVYYYSRQNDCLRQELTQFWESTDTNNNELPRTFAWAEEAFGTGPPQAVNLWMGNERSVSSMHKDHYENLFYVASGEKVFTLCPPADAPFLYEQECDSGQFHWDDDTQEWNVQLDEDTDEIDALSKPPPRARWIAADVTMKHNAEYLETFPLLQYTHPIEVKVKEGELLYLPALWFHRVTQTCETVGVNYWYDMKFESPVWTFFHFLQQLRSTQA